MLVWRLKLGFYIHPFYQKMCKPGYLLYFFVSASKIIFRSAFLLSVITITSEKLVTDQITRWKLILRNFMTWQLRRWVRKLTKGLSSIPWYGWIWAYQGSAESDWRRSTHLDWIGSRFKFWYFGLIRVQIGSNRCFRSDLSRFKFSVCGIQL